MEGSDEREVKEQAGLVRVIVHHSSAHEPVIWKEMRMLKSVKRAQEGLAENGADT